MGFELTPKEDDIFKMFSNTSLEIALQSIEETGMGSSMRWCENNLDFLERQHGTCA